MATPIEFSTISAMQAASATNGQVAHVLGYYAPADGGGGIFTLDTGSTATVDEGFVVSRTGGGTGRWLRSIEKIDVRMFGAKGDGVTNDRTPIQRALDAATVHGLPVHFGGKRYLVQDSSVRELQVGATLLARYRGILEIGFHAGATRPRIELRGEGATLYSDDERGDFSLGTAPTAVPPITWVAHAGAPSIFLINGKIRSLLMEGFVFERKVTGGRQAEPGQYSTTYPPPSGYLHVEDHPYGYNREAFLMMPSTEVLPGDDGEIDHVTVRQVKFVDCHRAFTLTNPPDMNFPRYGGKILNFNIESCDFLYPWGANKNPFPVAPGGGQGMLVTSWVQTLRVTNSSFDGASNNDLTGAYYPYPPDGFVFGNPQRLICIGNKVRHFAVEGITIATEGYLAGVLPVSLTMPAINAESSLITLDRALPAWIPLGYEVFAGEVDIPRVPPSLKDFGRAEISHISTDRTQVKLRNIGGVLNPAAGSEVNLSGWLLDPSIHQLGSAVVLGNEIDGSRVDGISQNASFSGDGNPGIRIHNIRCVVSGNTLINNTTGIVLVEYGYADGTMAGSTVSDNSIILPNTEPAIDPWYGTPSGSFTISSPSGGTTSALAANATAATVQQAVRANLTGFSNAVVSSVNVNAWEIDRVDYGAFADIATNSASLIPAGKKAYVENTREGNVATSEKWIVAIPDPVASGISILAKGVSVFGNSIRAPHANSTHGISISTNDNRITENTIIADARGGETNAGWGIIVGHSLAGNFLAGNKTENFHVGAGSNPGGDSSLTIESHISANDAQSTVVASSARFSRQFIQFKPASAGWYRLLRAKENFNGTLEISNVDLNGYQMSARVTLDFASYREHRNLIQEAYNQRDTYTEVAIVDQVMLGGIGAAELFIHVSRPAETPIEIVLNTPTPGVKLSDVPEAQIPVTQVTTFSPSAGVVKATITTSGSLPTLGGSVFLFDLPSASTIRAGGYAVSNVTTSTFDITVPSSTPIGTWSAAGGLFPTFGNTSEPWPGEKWLIFSKNGIKSLAGFGYKTGTNPISEAVIPEFVGQNFYNTTTGEMWIATALNPGNWQPVARLGAAANFTSLQLASGTAGAPALNFGATGDANTGIFQPEVDSVGISIDGSLVAKFTSAGLDLTGGLDIGFGSAAAPGFSFDGDEDTGMFRVADNVIGFAVNGLEVARIDAAGLLSWETVRAEEVSVAPATAVVGNPVARTVVLARQSTGAGFVDLTTDGAAPGANNQIVLEPGKTYQVTVSMTGRGTTGLSAGFFRAFCVENHSGTSAVVVNVDALSGNRDSTNYNISLGVNDTGGTDYLKVQGTGGTGQTVNWAAKVEILEVTAP